MVRRRGGRSVGTSTGAAPLTRVLTRALVVVLLAPLLVAAGNAGAARAAAPELATAPYGNLAEALQKSLYFYDAEKSGPSRSTGHQPLEWRGDSEPEDAAVPLVPGTRDPGHIVTSGTNLSTEYIEEHREVLDPDGDGHLDLSQGFHDAGDHVKFGQPQAYAASTLAWGLYEFRESYVATGTYEHILDELRWFNDYFLKSTFRDAGGRVVAFAYQVGNGAADHSWWGPPELQTTPRGAMLATADTPASDMSAGAAAALTAMSVVVRDEDPDYAARCLDTAQALYRFAVENRGLGESGGFYGSAFDDDELAWAAIWLYRATGERAYLDDIVAKDDEGIYTGYLNKIIKDRLSTWQNIWVHSWDVVWGGVFAMLAPLSKGVVDDALNAEYWYYFRWNAEYWTAGAVEHVSNVSGDSYLEASPAGYSVLNAWGSARYNTAAQLCALVYRRHSADDPGGSTRQGELLSQWALSQMNYLMGDNPLHRSMIVGFVAGEGDTSVQYPHHRAAHGSLTHSMFDPPRHRHTLWGALAGGPDAEDRHVDETQDYVYNEVTIDYNAAFVGALAGLYRYFGEDQPFTRWTPPAEPDTPPYWVEAKVEQENTQRTQVALRLHQEQSHPPARVDDLSVRYYFDVGELLANGLDIEDVQVVVYYDEAKSLGEKDVVVTGPTRVGSAGNLYHVEFAWPSGFYFKRDLQFGLISRQNPETFLDHWDGSNDYSRRGLSSTALGETGHIPVYRGGTLVHGAEPGADDLRAAATPPGPSSISGSTPGTPAACWAPTRTTSPGAATPTPAPSSGEVRATCTAAYEVPVQWRDGFQSRVVVSNTGDTPLTGWRVTWPCVTGQTLTEVWGGTLTQTGSSLGVTHLTGSDLVPVGESVLFGANGLGSSAAPTLTCTAW